MLTESEAGTTVAIFIPAACFQRARWRLRCAHCAPADPQLSLSREAINSRELLSSLNSAGSAQSCKLEPHRALQPLFCRVKGTEDKAVINSPPISLTLEVGQEEDKLFTSCLTL